ANYNVYSNSIKVSITTNNPKVFVIASGPGGNRAFGVYKLSDEHGAYDDFLTTGSISEADLPMVNNASGFTKNYPILSMVMPQASKLYVCTSSNCKGYAFSSGSCSICGSSSKAYNGVKDASTSSNNDEIVMACEFDLSGYGPGTYMFSSTNGRIRIYYLSVEGVESGDIGGGTEDPTSTVSYISTVDFVDSGVIITDTYEDYSYVLFIVALPATNSDTVIYFKRDDDDDGTNKVYYGTNGNGTVTNVNTTHQGVSFTDFTDYPQVNTNA
ncbi:MAG: hypothetical protein IJA65_06025, partial [Acholeplasmatales bacterium]|nr:hypothetical protein [Acholeplasmatales bacterium]